ncbi:uncharacterized protein LOC132162407 [Corylus avellana]|uniref:uncharacterized protein LOC132162407 n=1 Tax=Corylus avellana TaxID=13451 RepID=UPI00286BBD58|nr:uncharacterized protein LOC132162407 [Corylus avellana]
MDTSFDEDDDHEQPMNTSFGVDDDHEQMLTLSLSIGSRSSAPPPVSPLLQLQPTSITTPQPSLNEPIFWMPPPLSPSPSPPPSYLSWMLQPPLRLPSYLFMSNPPVSCQVGMPKLSSQVEALELSSQVEAPEPLLPSYHIVSNPPVSLQVEAPELSCQMEGLKPPSPSYLFMSNPPLSYQGEALAPALAPISCPGRARKHPAHVFKSGKSEALPAPYRWAKTRRASVHRLDYLISKGISVITGKLYCKRCDKQYVVKYDLRQKFREVASFVAMNRAAMNDRAPAIWMYPNLPHCQYCDQNNNVRPVHSKKRSINWLFLFLGQMLGCCKLAELKYFCKHTKNHRTGAKDRLLYLAYLDLCKQVDPNRSIHL